MSIKRKRQDTERGRLRNKKRRRDQKRGESKQRENEIVWQERFEHKEKIRKRLKKEEAKEKKNRKRKSIEFKTEKPNIKICFTNWQIASQNIYTDSLCHSDKSKLHSPDPLKLLAYGGKTDRKDI